jgi:hypothetical protein
MPSSDFGFPEDMIRMRREERRERRGEEREDGRVEDLNQFAFLNITFFDNFFFFLHPFPPLLSTETAIAILKERRGESLSVSSWWWVGGWVGIDQVSIVKLLIKLLVFRGVVLFTCERQGRFLTLKKAIQRSQRERWLTRRYFSADRKSLCWSRKRAMRLSWYDSLTRARTIIRSRSPSRERDKIYKRSEKRERGKRVNLIDKGLIRWIQWNRQMEVDLCGVVIIVEWAIESKCTSRDRNLSICRMTSIVSFHILEIFKNLTPSATIGGEVRERDCWFIGILREKQLLHTMEVEECGPVGGHVTVAVRKELLM